MSDSRSPERLTPEQMAEHLGRVTANAMPDWLPIVMGLDRLDQGTKRRIAAFLDPAQSEAAQKARDEIHDPTHRFADHALSFPPHPDGYFRSSALCSCGDFQWDGPSAEFVAVVREAVWSDWWDHVVRAVDVAERAAIQGGTRDVNPSTDSPLSAEEEAALRANPDGYPLTADSPAIVSAAYPYIITRLLATLDAARDRRWPTGPTDRDGNPLLAAHPESRPDPGEGREAEGCEHSAVWYLNRFGEWTQDRDPAATAQTRCGNCGASPVPTDRPEPLECER